jgi:hypothetical protein
VGFGGCDWPAPSQPEEPEVTLQRHLMEPGVGNLLARDQALLFRIVMTEIPKWVRW